MAERRRERFEWRVWGDGHTRPDLNDLEPGTIIECATPGHAHYLVTYLDATDPGPYHASGYGYMTYVVLRARGLFYRRARARIARGDFIRREPNPH